MWNRYWHDFGVHRLRLAALRLGLFGLLAYDLWVVFIIHAPRYGAGDMNATQFAWLDGIAPLPTAAIVGAGWLLGGFLAARAALGIAVKTSVVGLAVLYCGIYVWGQADSYQHHYFICLVLLVCALIPARAWLTRAPPLPAGDGPPDDVNARDSDARGWPLRMLYVSIAIMYFWTGVTKANPVWLSGDTLYQLMASPENRALVQSLADTLGMAPLDVYPLMAWMVMLGELAAGLFFIWRRLWIVGLLIVPWFHVGVEVIGFEIELFSWYMIVIDVVLLLPRRVYEAFERGWATLCDRLAGLPNPSATGPRIALGVMATAGAVIGAAWVPYAGVLGLVIGVGAFSILAFVRPGGYPLWRAVGHCLIGALLATSALATDAPFDYYRLWGGDLKKRAAGDPALMPEAIASYRAANRVTDGPARHFALGRLLIRTGETDAGLAAYAEGIERHTTALAAEKTASFKRPTDGDAQYDLAERHAQLASKFKTYAAALSRVGRHAEAQDLREKQSAHLRDGRDALQKARSLEPTSRRQGRIARSLDRSRR